MYDFERLSRAVYLIDQRRFPNEHYHFDVMPQKVNHHAHTDLDQLQGAPIIIIIINRITNSAKI